MIINLPALRPCYLDKAGDPFPSIYATLTLVVTLALGSQAIVYVARQPHGAFRSSPDDTGRRIVDDRIRTRDRPSHQRCNDGAAAAVDHLGVARLHLTKTAILPCPGGEAF